MSCGTRQVVVALRAGAEVISQYRDELVELDRAIGDADHGENLDRGLQLLGSRLDTALVDTPGAVLKLAATTLISSVGGAAGPLYGTALLRAASAVGESEELDGEAVANALRAAMDGVTARGRAQVGDKTMVDALSPAVDAAASTAGTGAETSEVLAAAARAAEDGASTTESLIARKGRASYLGERSVGHVDPGARSTALLLRAFAEAGTAR